MNYYSLLFAQLYMCLLLFYERAPFQEGIAYYSSSKKHTYISIFWHFLFNITVCLYFITFSSLFHLVNIFTKRKLRHCQRLFYLKWGNNNENNNKVITIIIIILFESYICIMQNVGNGLLFQYNMSIRERNILFKINI